MEDKNFGGEDIGRVPFQYYVNIHKASYFNIGDVVFLKSNPETAMKITKVYRIKNLVRVRWVDINEEVNFASIPPECILKYKHAGLLVYKDWPQVISLN